MQFNLSALTTLALATLAVATPARRNDPTTGCTTGSLQCCNSVESAKDAAVTTLLGLLGVVLQDLDVLVGITCSPIVAGGTSCSAQTVCCDDASFNGVIAVGCNPININL